MVDNPDDEENLSEDTNLEDLLADDDDDDEFQDMTENDDLDDDLSDFDDDDTLSDEEITLSDDTDSDDELTEESEFDEEPSEEELTSQAQAEAPKEEKTPLASQQSSEVIRPARHTESSSVDELPLTVSVELSRIETSVRNVIEMRPGNLLDLHLEEEGIVDLVISGKKVGQGELVKLGETVGVRILNIGTKAL